MDNQPIKTEKLEDIKFEDLAKADGVVIMSERDMNRLDMDSSVDEKKKREAERQRQAAAQNLSSPLPVRSSQNDDWLCFWCCYNLPSNPSIGTGTGHTHQQPNGYTGCDACCQDCSDFFCCGCCCDGDKSTSNDDCCDCDGGDCDCDCGGCDCDC